MKKHTLYLAKLFAVSAIVALIIAGCETTDINGPTDARDDFVGSWNAVENPGPNQTTFPVTITKDTITDRILIGNFNNLGGSVKPYGVVNNTTLTIPSQTKSGYTISGSGSYNSGTQKISLNYTVNDGISTETYTATLSK